MINLGANFYSKLKEVASEVGMKPEDILAIMVSESGINPGAQEKKFRGGGLIGFMPKTQKNLGFKGSPDDFIKLSGEEQLDYVKQYIKGVERFNGGPFKSAAQYYIGNFFPVALKLPGIKHGDPETIFVEDSPKTIKDPKTGKIWSKKYYDIGIHLSPLTEKSAYKHNSLFWGNVPGAITYGDMVRQVEKNKKDPIYISAIKQLSNPSSLPIDKTKKEDFLSNTQYKEPSFIDKTKNFFSNISKLLNHFASVSENNSYVITITSSIDKIAAIEYAKVLSTGLNEYLNAKSKICADHNNIEIETRISGDKKIIHSAIKELSASLSPVFHMQTKLNGQVFITIATDIVSHLPEIEPKMMDLYSRSFILKMAKQ